MAIVSNASEMILKKFGRSIEPIGKKGFQEKPEYVVPTGSLTLNSQLEYGGIPQCAVVEAYGWEGSGKSLLMYLAIAQSQKKYPDRPCAIIDAENQFKFQASWAESVGVDLDALQLIPCSITEEIADIIYFMIVGKAKFSEKNKKPDKILEIIEPGNYGIIGVDSVTKMVPRSLVEKGADEGQIRGIKASALSLLLDKVQGVMTRSDCNSKTILFFINQLRKNPKSGLFENPEYRTCGNSLKFANTVALQCKKIPKSQQYDKNNRITSHLMRVRIEKNKCGQAPAGWADLRIRYDSRGVDNYEELIEVGILNKVLTEARKKIKVTLENFEGLEFTRSTASKFLSEHKELRTALKELFKSGKVFDVNKKGFKNQESNDGDDDDIDKD